MPYSHGLRHDTYANIYKSKSYGLLKWSKSGFMQWAPSKEKQPYAIRIPETFPGVSKEAGERISRVIKREWAVGGRTQNQAEAPEIYTVKGITDGRELIIAPWQLENPFVPARVTFFDPQGNLLNDKGMNVLPYENHAQSLIHQNYKSTSSSVPKGILSWENYLPVWKPQGQ